MLWCETVFIHCRHVQTNRLLVYWWIKRNHPQPFAHDFPLKASKTIRRTGICWSVSLHLYPVHSSIIQQYLANDSPTIHHGIFGVGQTSIFSDQTPSTLRFPPEKNMVSGHNCSRSRWCHGSICAIWIHMGPFCRATRWFAKDGGWFAMVFTHPLILHVWKMAGWWFGNVWNHFWFFHILGTITPTDELHHFSEGWGSTTNQMDNDPISWKPHPWHHCRSWMT